MTNTRYKIWKLQSLCFKNNWTFNVSYNLHITQGTKNKQEIYQQKYKCLLIFAHLILQLLLFILPDDAILSLPIPIFHFLNIVVTLIACSQVYKQATLKNPVTWLRVAMVLMISVQMICGNLESFKCQAYGPLF